jgi:hypothetical protein
LTVQGPWHRRRHGEQEGAHEETPSAARDHDYILAVTANFVNDGGNADGTVATYDVASDLVTVTPNDVEPIGAKPLDGVLLPCPDLP